MNVNTLGNLQQNIVSTDLIERLERFDVEYVNEEVGCRHFYSDTGDYVLAEDALALQARIEELEKSLNTYTRCRNGKTLIIEWNYQEYEI